jgi:hypothetical protein
MDGRDYWHRYPLRGEKQVRHGILRVYDINVVLLD